MSMPSNTKCRFADCVCTMMRHSVAFLDASSTNTALQTQMSNGMKFRYVMML